MDHMVIVVVNTKLFINHKLDKESWHCSTLDNSCYKKEDSQKNATHAKAKKSGSAKIRAKLETLRREIKADIRKQPDRYVNNLVGDVQANPKDFYRYIKSQKKDAQGIPPLKRRNGGGFAKLESEKAAEFNGQFTDVFTKSEYSQVPLLDRSVPFMEDIVVTKEGVTKLLKGLNTSKALGPDELHPRVLKELASELGPIFFCIYSSSQLTLVRYLRSGHLQILVPCSRRVIDHLLAIIVPFP